MAIIQLQWNVPNLSTLLADGYDQQKIEVENTPTVWTEATRSTTRLPLVENVEDYLWETPSDVTLNFRAVPYNSSTDTDGTAISISNKKVRGYCTVEEIRAEGWDNVTLFPDSKIQAKIDYATSMIDRICGQRFDAYYGVQTVDIKRAYPEVHLDIPIAALLKVEEVQISSSQSDIDLSSIIVYNRHLTEGLINPDDRRNPMIAYGQGGTSSSRKLYGSGRFLRGNQVIKLFGIWGFTELGTTGQAGETELDSQIPLSYGSTPAEINRAAMLLTTAYMPTLSDGGAQEAVDSSRIIEEKTRDQSYKLDKGSVTEDSAYGFTGIQEVDTILMRYCGPASVGGV